MTNNVVDSQLTVVPSARADLDNVSAERFRVFRAEKTYSVSAGKWYFELEVRGGFPLQPSLRLLQRSFERGFGVLIPPKSKVLLLVRISIGCTVQ